MPVTVTIVPAPPPTTLVETVGPDRIVIGVSEVSPPLTTLSARDPVIGAVSTASVPVPVPAPSMVTLEVVASQPVPLTLQIDAVPVPAPEKLDSEKLIRVERAVRG